MARVQACVADHPGAGSLEEVAGRIRPPLNRIRAIVVVARVVVVVVAAVARSRRCAVEGGASCQEGQVASLG